MKKKKKKKKNFKEFMTLFQENSVIIKAVYSKNNYFQDFAIILVAEFCL